MARIAPRHCSLLDVWTLRGICVPWVTTNRYRLVWCVWILMGVRDGRGVLCGSMSKTEESDGRRRDTDHVIVVLNLDLSIMVVDGWKRVALLAARRSRDNR